MNNPLIEKYNEIHNPKPPKPVEKPKAKNIKTYDVDDTKISFLQVAEKIQNGEAKVTSMSMKMGDDMSMYRTPTKILWATKITFEVVVDEL